MGRGAWISSLQSFPFTFALYIPQTIYSSISVHRDPVMVEKITKALSLTIPTHILRSRDPRALLTALFAAWIPLSTALLVTVTDYLPAPPKAQAARLPELIDESP